MTAKARSANTEPSPPSVLGPSARSHSSISSLKAGGALGVVIVEWRRLRRGSVLPWYRPVCGADESAMETGWRLESLVHDRAVHVVERIRQQLKTFAVRAGKIRGFASDDVGL